MFQALENLVHALKDAIGDLGWSAAVRTLTEHWEGAVSPSIEVVLSIGREQQAQVGAVADLYVYPVRPQACEVEVEVTLPAHTITMEPGQLWSRAKEIAGAEVGISGIQRYFRGEAGKTLHIHLESHFIIDYWFEVEVPKEGEASDEEWEQFDGEVAAIAQGVVGLLELVEGAGE